MATHHAELWQRGKLLETKEGPSTESLFRDMAALATIHESDGPLEIRMDGRVWTPQPRMERVLR